MLIKIILIFTEKFAIPFREVSGRGGGGHGWIVDCRSIVAAIVFSYSLTYSITQPLKTGLQVG